MHLFAAVRPHALCAHVEVPASSGHSWKQIFAACAFANFQIMLQVQAAVAQDEAAPTQKKRRHGRRGCCRCLSSIWPQETESSRPYWLRCFSPAKAGTLCRQRLRGLRGCLSCARRHDCTARALGRPQYVVMLFHRVP